MIYAKTPTSTLTKKQLKKIVKRSMTWCKSNFGENKRKQYKISHMVGEFPFLEDSYGCYDQFDNVVIVNLSNCPTVGRVTATVIHEYVHARQKDKKFDKLYNQYQKEHGYEQNPFELEAREVSKKHENECLIWVYNKIYYK